MKKLNFPILKGDPMPPPVLSMDEYADFVEFYLETFRGQEEDEAGEENKIRVPFKLIP